MSHHVQATYADLSAGECLHITATIEIVENIDAVNGISPVNEFAGNYYPVLISITLGQFSVLQLLDHTYTANLEVSSLLIIGKEVVSDGHFCGCSITFINVVRYHQHWSRQLFMCQC